MAKKTTNSNASAPANGGPSQDDAPTGIIPGASNPSGENGPDGTNTSESSGDAAGSAPADTVKPQGKDDTSTTAMPADATNSQPAPGEEASSSGGTVSNASPSQGEESGGADAAAGITAFSQAQAEAIVSKMLGTSFVRRWFLLLDGRVRHNNKMVKAGGKLHLSPAEHRRLFANDQVLEWELGDE